MKEGNTNKNKHDLFSEELQQELEKLSWEFLLKEKEEQASAIKKESESEKFNYYQIKEPAGGDETGEYYNPKQDDYKNFAFWQKNDEFNPNNLRRDSGIIFDEAKLKAHRAVEWTKAPKLRESRAKMFLFRIGLWSAKLLFKICFGVTVAIGKTVVGAVIFFYRAVKGSIVFIWQVAVAFKYAFIYIFGGFNLSFRSVEVVEANEVAEELLAEDNKKFYKHNWRFRAAGIFAVAALFLILPLQIYLFYSRAEQTKAVVLGASDFGVQHLLQAGIAGKDLNIQDAGREFVLAGQEFERAKNSFRGLGILANGLASLAPDVRAGTQLLEVAIKSANVGRILAKTSQLMAKFTGNIDYKQIEADSRPEAKSMDKIDWRAVDRDLEQAVADATAIEKIIKEVDLGNARLSAYREQAATVKNQLPMIASLLEDYRDLTKIVVSMLGVDEPKRWLLVFQNNAELRPTGGFLGSYAVVDLKNGEIKKIEVPGGGFYDLKGSLAVMVDAPYPFHLFSPIWQPWNANWFFDWPSSAEKITWFYDKSGGPSVDGVVSFTPDVLEDLLKLTGQIEMPDYKMTIDDNNFRRLTQAEVEINYDKAENKPKKFIGDLLPMVLDKVFSLEGEQRVEALQIIFDSLKSKDLLTYFKDQDIQKIADKLKWTGRVEQYDKDYLAIVHTNIAGGKTDQVIKNTVEHKIEIMNNGEIVDAVTLTREHQGKVGDVFEGQTNTDFVRFYVPQDSKLLATSGFDPMPTDREFQTATSGVEADPDLTRLESNLRVDGESGTRIVDEFGKTSFGNWLSVAPGEIKKVSVKYLLPWRIQGGDEVRTAAAEEHDWWSLVKQYFGFRKKQQTKQQDYIYGLLVQKQPGSNDDQFSSNLTVDGGWLVGEYLPKEEATVSNNSLRVNFDIDGDKYYGAVIKET
ncbi:MAG: hypothetical protein UV02_C0045G0003 [Candidatus Kuenenbacteria bacterium GW2011_GWA2_42_15]|uniref:DUF4012 domain-containing protein n=1 Tax=Candidatus Kuenenbacteria bacterium GW2011_GWA2_42_15 TaxID=1618677 RepID=A0A0G0YUD6_9BACT|nr:MAG: hypothetical protein UV02_C0045G0003 [Candidatus Kuenenbacteria bacterium GW2011_GWA2_42_15]